MLVPNTPHPTLRRPVALLVGPIDGFGMHNLPGRLAEAGFVVIRTSSNVAAVAYGKQLAPDIVLSAAKTARLLGRCYPYGPRWVSEVDIASGLTALRGPGCDTKLFERVVFALQTGMAA